MVGNKSIPMEQRFWSRVDKSGGPDACWIWTGGKGHGYGVIPWPGHQAGGIGAHCYSYMLAHDNNPIPKGMKVCHSCDNPPCVNPKHLFLGTQVDNMRDMYNKKRDVNHVHPECKAKGDRNGSRLHPERILKGEQHPNAKLTEADVLNIRSSHQKGETLTSIAKRYSVTNTLIGYIVRRKIWRHI